MASPARRSAAATERASWAAKLRFRLLSQYSLMPMVSTCSLGGAEISSVSVRRSRAGTEAARLARL